MSRQTRMGLALAVLLAGCQGATIPPGTTGLGPTSPAPSPAAMPSPPSGSRSPTDPPSPAPSTPGGAAPSSGPQSTRTASRPSSPTPPSDLRTAAVRRHDGIRVRVELQRNPLVAGEPSWVRVTVTNTGTDVVTWFHDGCALAAWVGGESQVPWAEGRRLPAQAQMFKQYALGTFNGQPLPPASIRYVPAEMLGAGSYGCADIGMTDRIKPGGKLRQTLWWSGYTDVNRALPPSGPMLIKATAAYYWRGTREPDDIPDQAIDLALDAWVVGGTGVDRLSPAEVVDAAVADPAFAAFLETQPLANGREEIAWYDAGADAWEVGVMPWYETEPPRIRGVRIHPVTGEVLGPLDRPWDEEADGAP